MFDWMESVSWVYRASVPELARTAREEVWWVLQGVDYAFTLLVDGRQRHRQEGMFRPVEICLARAGESLPSTVEVHIDPPPMKPGARVGRWQADQSCKPPYSYGWDWHPRLIPSGIWDDTWLETRSVSHLREVDFSYRLENGNARLFLRMECSIPGQGSLHITLRNAHGDAVIDEQTSGLQWSGILHAPELWWPHDQGGQCRYHLEVALWVDGALADTFAQRVGFRSVRLVPFDRQASFRMEMPISQPTVPITLEINGRRIFAKGSNWVPPEIFPGLVDESTYRPLLELAKGANMNLLRHWGGGYIQKEAFYEMCDEMGLLVWQEFPLACLPYEDNSHYLAVLDSESRAILRRLSHHPCIAIWCGGNELFNGWSGATPQTKAIRLLDKNCYEMAREIPFLPTSPMSGMAHGDYRFRFGEREVFQTFAAAQATAYTEFGVPACSPVEVLQSFLPADAHWPPQRGTSWETHHAFGAWDGDKESWLMLSQVEHYFGPQTSLEALAANSARLQSAGYQFIFEEARRQKPICSMALNWCFNEPWPTAANNSLVNWPARARPALDAVRTALRPTQASIRMPRFAFAPGDSFTAGLFLLHDGPEPLPPACIEVWIECGGLRAMLARWQCPGTEANKNQAGPEFPVDLPSCPDSAEFTLVAHVAEKSEWDSAYVHLIR